jgi:LmbE family N-acetylglucosaminyl deacetylase
MDNPFISHLRKPPKLKGIKKALFIQPHADDNQIGAGGMMALLADSGAEVYELTVTDDRRLEQDKEGLTTRQMPDF